MNFKSFIQRIYNQLRGEDELPDEQVIRLIKRLERTREKELACDELFELIDEYAEANLSGEQVARLHPLIVHHLEMCRECDEEYQALMNVLEEKSVL